MKNDTLYPTDEITVKEEFSSYFEFKDFPGGHETSIKIPNKYDVNLKVYNLIPGVSVIINHANLKDRYRESDDMLEYAHPEDTLLINFIRRGRCQLEVNPDKYMFVKNNDIYLYIKESFPNSFSYLGEVTIYHILINRRQFKKLLTEYTQEYMDVMNYFFKECEKEKSIMFKAPEKIIEIIEELEKTRYNKEITNLLLFQLKTIEIITFLYELEIEDEKINQRTYSDATIRVVRNIKNSLSRNIASYVSLETLSLSYGINLTTLKNCFKDMYGKPLYTWYKEYKFYRARELIKNTDYPISKIANMIGYKSSSKFAKSFKKEMGVLPSSYRKNKK